MLNVRPYMDKDRANVRRICLNNADCANAPEATRQYILLMYCDYYIEQEPTNCFVAVNEEDEAVGYIICAENYDRYEQIFREIYLPVAASISHKRYVDARLDLLSHSMFKTKYPSHFHIDIDVQYQRQGAGSMLINALKEHLKTKRLNGVMLVCGADNQLAINFYQKNGFKTLLTTELGKAMAIDFND